MGLSPGDAPNGPTGGARAGGAHVSSTGQAAEPAPRLFILISSRLSS